MGEHPQLLALRESIQDPQSFWGSIAKQLHWHKPFKTVLEQIPDGSNWPDSKEKSKRQADSAVAASSGVQGQTSVQMQESPWRWFPGGEISTSYNCLDRHVFPPDGVESLRDQPAIIWESPATGSRATYTYAEMLHEVKALAGAMHHLGVRKGDRILIYMPMIPQALFAMHASVRIGAIHSVVFGGFAGKELAKRIDDCQPDLIVSASCGVEPKGSVWYIPLVDEAIRLAKHKPRHTIIYQRPGREHKLGRGEVDYDDIVGKVKANASGFSMFEDPVAVKSQDEIYVLYTSGTTGLPKGVAREAGGHAVVALYLMTFLMGQQRGNRFFTASDVGWVVGHTFIVYAPLLLGCTTIVFEGKPVGMPDAGIFWKIIQDCKVNGFFTAPTALRAIRRDDPNAELMKKYDLRSLKALFLAGERSEPGLITMYQDLLRELAAEGCQVVDHMWSTESGSPMTGIAQGAPFSHPSKDVQVKSLAPRPGSCGFPMPGHDIRIVDDSGREIPRGEMGNVVVQTPLNPCFLRTLWNNHAGFEKSYMNRFRGRGNWFDTGDAGMIDADGYVHILSRTDDIINVAAHRLSTGLIEQVVASHPSVAECCVVGQPDKIKGHVPVALVALKTASGVTTEQEEAGAQKAKLALLREINSTIRNDLGAVATLSEIYILSPGSKLPKTRSGKTLRRSVRAMVEAATAGQWDAEIPVPPTVESMDAIVDAKTAIYISFEKQQKARL